MHRTHRLIHILAALVLLMAVLPFSQHAAAEPEDPSSSLPTGLSELQDLETGQAISMNSYYPQAIPYGNRVFFFADGGGTGVEPWITDGTNEGTRMIKNTAPQHLGVGELYAGVPLPVVWNGKVYFLGLEFDAEYDYFPALWVSDGTSDGTVVVTRLPDPITAFKSGTTGFTFLTKAEYGNKWSIWWSNGTAAQTYVVYSWEQSSGPISQYQEYNGYVYYTNQANQLLRCNLSTKQTAAFDISVDNIITVANGLLFYTKISTGLGREVWRTDGTVQGTYVVKDLSPGILNTHYVDHEVIGNTLYLLLDVEGSNNPAAVYFTSGNTNALTKVSLSPSGYVSLLYKANGALFFIQEGGEDGLQRWVNDGTSAGMRRICPTCQHGLPHQAKTEFGILPGVILYSARNNTYGSELWISNGTDASTRFFMDILPGDQSSNPHTFLSMDGYIFFVAADPVGFNHKPMIYRPTPNPIVTRADKVQGYYGEFNTIDVLANDEHQNGDALKLLDFAPKTRLKRDDRGTPDDLTDDRLILGVVNQWDSIDQEATYWVADSAGNRSAGRLNWTMRHRNFPPTDLAFVGIVKENAPYNQEVGTLKITEQGFEASYQCRFTQPNSIFKISYQSVYSLGLVDYESHPDGYQFEVTCVDYEGLSITKTIRFPVENINEPPVPYFEPIYKIDEDGEASWRMVWMDPENDPILRMDIVVNPAHGMAATQGCAGSPCVLTYKPDPNFTGRDILKVTATDPILAKSDPVAVIIDVLPVDDDPPVMKTIHTFVRQNEIKPYQITLSGIAAGPYETGPVTVAVSTDNPAMLVDLAVNYTEGSEGTLSFTLHPEEGREALVTVTLSDGVNETEYTFKVIVTDNPPLYLPMLGR